MSPLPFNDIDRYDAETNFDYDTTNMICKHKGNENLNVKVSLIEKCLK